MSETTPITDEERESARRHFMPGVMRAFSGVMRSGSVMEAYEARLQAAEAEIERLKGALEAIDKKADEPMADVADFGTAAWNEEAASHRGQLKWEMQQIARAAISKESK